ncbi:hypothetical protein HOD29_02310 [archaeon]|jgi:small subunit ribosomal protein S2|nr:hypothetical protein [archaeon]
MVKVKTEEKIETQETELKGAELIKAAEAESIASDQVGLEESVPSKTDVEDKTEIEEKVEKKELSLEEKKKALLERAAKLKEEKTEKLDTEALKEKVKVKKKGEMLIPLDDYVKSGIYLGTRVVTPDMKKYVYRRRADGLAIFNTDLIDEKIKEGIEYLSKFNPEDVVLICKRQSGWKAAKKFSELTGIKVFTKKYPAGIMTNTDLEDFFENEMTIITDAWLDKNALKDTLDVRKEVLMICGTNNFSKGANQIIIGNNKSGKSLGVIFYLLARGYCKSKGIEADVPDLDWWIDDAE